MKTNFILGAAAVMSALSMVATPVMAADTTLTTETGTVPVNITVEPTPINVTVPQSIDLTVAADTNDAVIGNGYTVANNAKSSVIVIDSFKSVETNNWNLVDKTIDFKNLPLDSNQLYLGAKFGTDTSFVNLKNTYTPTDNELAPETSKSILFEGKTGSVRTKVDGANVANITVTLHQK